MNYLLNVLNLSPLTGDEFDYTAIVVAGLAAVAIIAVLFFLRKNKPK